MQARIYNMPGQMLSRSKQVTSLKWFHIESISLNLHGGHEPFILKVILTGIAHVWITLVVQTIKSL